MDVKRGPRKETGVPASTARRERRTVGALVSRVVLDLHGARARHGVDIDAFEAFLEHFCAALREYGRAGEGAITRKGGRPSAREAAAAAFRLVEFKPGSGVATLAPSVSSEPGSGDLVLDESGESPALTTLRGLMASAVNAEEGLPGPVVEALGSARRATGEDGSFGVTITGDREVPRVLFDEMTMERLHRPDPDSTEAAVTVTGRLHMIEADPPNRRVGIRAQDGVEWRCTYPDHLRPLVTTLIERLVRISGTGRRHACAAGRLRIDGLDPLPEHTQDELFTVETIPLTQLRAEQAIEGPQGLDALVDENWEDDEESRLFLEATLGPTQNP